MSDTAIRSSIKWAASRCKDDAYCIATHGHSGPHKDLSRTWSRQNDLTRLCRDCELTKPTEDFGWRTVRGTHYRESYCKPCKALRTRAWRQKRKDEKET